MTNNIPVYFLDSYIYLDDTIRTIKKKIFKYVRDIALETIYLFCAYKHQLNTLSIYDNLTQGGKLELNKLRLSQFFLNINRPDYIDKLETKSVYTYDDLLNFDLDNKEFIVNKALGEKFVRGDKLFPFLVNPYEVEEFDIFLQTYVSELITTTNKSLLMTNFDSNAVIHNNTIYVCNAPNVLAYTQGKKLQVMTCLKIYYPNLIEAEINSIELLQDKMEELRDASQKLLTAEFEQNNKNIALFYDIYNQKTSELEYINKGISSLEFTIHPKIAYNLPLDIVFKIIHATQTIPLIKYNPSRKMENIYRLYTKTVSTKGKKIPYLTRSTILKLMKEIGKSKSVACYIEKSDGIPIICQFNDDASITIKIQFDKPQIYSLISDIITETVNPIIISVRKVLAHSGYTLPLYTSLDDSNIEIVDIAYGLTISIKKNFDVSEIIGCVSSIFNVIEGNSQTGIVMRFKKVSDYSKLDSIEAFILDLIKNEADENEIIEGLVNNFRLSKINAREELVKVVNAAEVVHSLYKKKQISIKKSPGFLTLFKLDKFIPIVQISVAGISNLHYLKTIPIYLD